MSGINPKIDTQRLIEATLRFGKHSRETNQITRRLSAILPDRLQTLKLEYQREHAASRAERLALCDDRYVGYIDELVTINAEARFARIQYETHMMLFEARRSLRGLHATRRSQSRQRSTRVTNNDVDS